MIITDSTFVQSPTNNHHETKDLTVQKTEETSKSCFYAYTSRTARNFIRISLAGCLSLLGAGISSDPRLQAVFGGVIAAVWIGGIISGLGNGASTYLAWETDTEDRIAALENKVRDLEAQLNSQQV